MLINVNSKGPERVPHIWGEIMNKKRNEQNKRKGDFWERFSRFMYGSMKWKSIVSVVMAVVVFSVTYMLILPALTLDENTAADEPGIEVASADGELVEKTGGSLYADDVIAEDDELVVDGTVEETPESVSSDDELEYQEDGEVFLDAEEETTYSAEEVTFGDDEVFEYESPFEEEGLYEEEELIDVDGEWIVDEEGSEEVSDEDSLDELAEDEGWIIDEEEESLPIAGTLYAYGDDYTVALTYTEEAEIPEGAELYAAEIPEKEDGIETAEYQQFVEKTNDILSYEEEYISFARFFDISIRKDGEEIHPSAPVAVEIEVADSLDENDEVKAVHFEETETEEDSEEEPEAILNEDETTEVVEEEVSEIEGEEVADDELAAEEEIYEEEFITETVEDTELDVPEVAEVDLTEETLPDPETTNLVVLDTEIVYPDENSNAVAFETDGFSVFGNTCLLLTEATTGSQLLTQLKHRSRITQNFRFTRLQKIQMNTLHTVRNPRNHLMTLQKLRQHASSISPSGQMVKRSSRQLR